MNEENPNADSQRKPLVNEERPTGYRFYDQPESDPAGYSPFATAPLAAAPPTAFAERATATANDDRQLDQLSLGYKIYAALHALLSCIPFIHLFMGIMIVTGGFGDGRDGPPPMFGWFFIILALVFITLGWALSACNFYAGKFLKERRNYTFCFVMSCINCVFMPLGTLLGVFSLIVLLRDPVKDAFNRNETKS